VKTFTIDEIAGGIEHTLDQLNLSEKPIVGVLAYVQFEDLTYAKVIIASKPDEPKPQEKPTT